MTQLIPHPAVSDCTFGYTPLQRTSTTTVDRAQKLKEVTHCDRNGVLVYKQSCTTIAAEIDKHVVKGRKMKYLIASSLLAIVAYYFGSVQHSRSIPAHLRGSTVTVQPNLISEEVAEQVMDVVKKLRQFPTVARDLEFYTTLNEHVGEAQLANAQGGCDNRYLTPSQKNASVCLFNTRFDVAKHYLLTGGIEGLKELPDSLTGRVQSFFNYNFGPEKYPPIQKLFASPTFQNVAKSVCPDDKQTLDTFQVNFILQLPGQTVALHIDAPYFWGATRFHYPQWLLIAMAYSGLFLDKFVDQVQLVTYVHKWKEERGGEFVYWNGAGEQTKLLPTSLTGVAVDGSKTLHAAAVYQPDVKPPKMKLEQLNLLTYDKKTDVWVVTSDGKEVGRYVTDDLRITVVYRAMCFASEQHREKYRSRGMKTTDGMMPLEKIFDRFCNDLIARRRLTGEQFDKLSRLDLALLLMDEYIRYPLPTSAIIPFNYCSIARLYPSLTALLRWFCD